MVHGLVLGALEEKPRRTEGGSPSALVVALGSGGARDSKRGGGDRGVGVGKGCWVCLRRASSEGAWVHIHSLSSGGRGRVSRSRCMSLGARSRRCHHGALGVSRQAWTAQGWSCPGRGGAGVRGPWCAQGGAGTGRGGEDRQVGGCGDVKSQGPRDLRAVALGQGGQGGEGHVGWVGAWGGLGCRGGVLCSVQLHGCVSVGSAGGRKGPLRGLAAALVTRGCGGEGQTISRHPSRGWHGGGRDRRSVLRLHHGQVRARDDVARGCVGVHMAAQRG